MLLDNDRQTDAPTSYTLPALEQVCRCVSRLSISKRASMTVCKISLCLLLLSLSNDVSGQEAVCEDHPRLKESCQRLPNLKLWCSNSKSSTGGGSKNNVAEVCRASCGLCTPTTAATPFPSETTATASAVSPSSLSPWIPSNPCLVGSFR